LTPSSLRNMKVDSPFLDRKITDMRKKKRIELPR